MVHHRCFRSRLILFIIFHSGLVSTAVNKRQARALMLPLGTSLQVDNANPVANLTSRSHCTHALKMPQRCSKGTQRGRGQAFASSGCGGQMMMWARGEKKLGWSRHWILQNRVVTTTSCSVHGFESRSPSTLICSWNLAA
jgi:hypothetical protein